MYSNRVQYKKSSEIRIEVEAIRRYAQGKSPYAGLPIVDDGSRRPAVFLRSHLVAAVSSGILTAIYDSQSHSLTLNGGKSKYVLRDLIATEFRQPWQVKDELIKWADRKRKTVATRKLPANLRLDGKRREEVAKLERRLAKIHVYKPQNPACVEARERHDGSKVWMRDSVETWATQRPQRKALGKLYGKYLQNLYKPMGRFPWADVYKDIEAIGLRIDSYNSWQRVRTRVAHKGLSLPEYLKRLWEFASLNRKPYDCDPYDIARRIESYRQEKQNYLAACREAQFIKDQITNVKACSEPFVLQQAKAA